MAAGQGRGRNGGGGNDSHGDVKYSIVNTLNNMVMTMHGVR